jgi:hypothetical protein
MSSFGGDLALHNDLIEQAHHLALREKKKPRQASLRRAISTAYYALFHMLLHEATLLMFPHEPAQLRHRASRAFSHGEARSVCEQFARTGIKDLTADPLEPALMEIAATFVELQEARHRADYDLAETFDRFQVVSYVDKAKGAIAKWKIVKNTPNANVFVAALLLHSRWNRYNK